MASARLTLNTFKYNHYLYPAVFVLLIYLKDFFPALYLKLMKKDTPHQEILHGLKAVYPEVITEEEFQPFLYVEVQLMMLYDNSLSERAKGQQLTKKDSMHKTHLMIKSNVDKSDDGERFLSYLEEFRSQRRYSTSLNHLTDRINLMESFVSDADLP